MRRIITTWTALFAVAIGLGIASADAEASHCRIGDSGYTTNRAGDVARFRSLHAMQGQNCASARYVLNRWLRRKFRRSYSRRLPRRFYDGYVTWYCGKVSYYRWRCDEFESNTAFRFWAAIVN
jgi:hypothetical protein